MIQIRRGVFETNSSSTHSISIRHKDDGLEESYLVIEDDGYIHTQLGEFGWEIETYNSQSDKLSYLITMLCEVNGIDTNWYDHHNIEQIRSKLDDCEDFKKLNKKIIQYTSCENGLYLDDSQGYIDHQSCEDYSSLSEFLADWGVDSIIQFIFDSNVTVHTDNDNH